MSETLSHTRREDLSAKETATLGRPALYVVLEGERALEGGLRAPLDGIDELRIGRGTTRSFRVEGDRTATLEIPDPRMSSKHARLIRERARASSDGDGEATGWLLEDVGSTNGSFVEGKRATQALLDEPTIITLGATCLLFDPEEAVPEGVKNEAVDAASLRSRPRGTATLVPVVEHTMPRLVRVAMSKLSVLLLGESGAGKEVLARTIHQLSGRQGPFVAINCGALAPTLVESQLFGHVRGAFSGAARDEPGLVRASSGGTLFLDEIGELPPSAQATLLRVLQEKEVLPVGGTKPVPVDLRVVSATLKPIDGSEATSFRPDLYARISAFVHRLTPLRERRGDIGLLIADLLPRLAPERAERIRFAPDLATALGSHAFPLNVRELEHLLSVALVTSTEDLLRRESVGEALRPTRERAASETDARESRRDAREALPASAPARSAQPRALTEEELKLKEELTRALTTTRGNVSEIARAMGKTRMQIHRWMKRFGLDPESFRG
ncbi:MAG: sigma 54-interacting transcriptional regulator [Labilithrix sp.]|nr:sigma 54-interacting transcriptional regulator [Labilithrix sp.]